MMYEQNNPAAQTARLEDYLQALRNHWILAVVTTVIGLALGVWFAGQRTVTYEASAAVALNPTPAGSTNLNLVAPSVERESEIMESRQVAETVIELLGLELSSQELLEAVEVEFVPQSDVLRVTAKGADDQEVADIANGMVETYVTQREDKAKQFTQDAIDIRQIQFDEYGVTLAALDAQIDALAAQRDTVDGANAALDSELGTLRNEYSQILTSQREIQKSIDDLARSEGTRLPAAEIIRLSEAPGGLVGIPSWLIILGGLLGGAVLGVVSGFVVDRLDRTARDERALGLALGSNVLGEIPSFAAVGRVGPENLIMLDETAKGRAHRSQEAFRRLRSAVQFLGPTAGREGCLVLGISSAHPGEGKSTMAANLAIALAQNGSSVTLVSADLRRPTLERLFAVESKSGLSNVLGGLDETIPLLDTGVPNLKLIPAGRTPKNPSELLGVALFEAMIAELRQQTSFVIIDTPPVLSVADALVIGRQVDGLLIVVDSRATDVDDVLQVRVEADRSGTVLLGGVLNRDRRRRGARFGRDRYAYATEVVEKA